MFDHVSSILQSPGSMPHAAMLASAWPSGPGERRDHAGELSGCLARMLDEIDYGMLVLGSSGELKYLNHAARAELDGEHPLQLRGGRLQAKRTQDAAPLADGLAASLRGLRRLLTLGEGEHRVSVSVVPLGAEANDGAAIAERLTLLVLGKRQVCERLSVQGFARSLGLTAAETRVLEGLCSGMRPVEIAAAGGVAIATVRTQIGSIRAKTGAASIRELVRQVAVLPPLVGALRGSAAMPRPPAS